MNTESPTPALTLEDIRHRPVLTVDEYAAFMGIGRGLAYSAVHAGDVPSIKIGRRLLVPVPPLLRSLGDEPSATATL